MLLVAGYVLLTALRDFRDNFAVELWTAMGFGGDVLIFSQSELPVAVIALSGLGALMLVRDNLRALLAMHAVIIGGALLLGLSTLAFQAGWLGPLPWMILTGAGCTSPTCRSTPCCSTAWSRRSARRPMPAS